MEKIEINYELKKLSGNGVDSIKIKILPGAYPVVLTELPSSEIDIRAFIPMLQELAKTYRLDEARMVVIGHYIQGPTRVGPDDIEWLYYDFRRGKDLKLQISGSNIRKLDVNLVYALLEKAGWAEEMARNSKPNALVVQTLADGSREISVLYNDAMRELKATIAPSVGAEQVREIARTISSEVGVTEIKEETSK